MTQTKDRCILIVGCFDTKGKDFAYLRKCILEAGEKVITINTGVMGEGEDFPVDYESQAVAGAAGQLIQELRKTNDRGYAVKVMGMGAAHLIGQLVAQNRVKAAIGMGGGGGTYIALLAMQSIPFGIPKLCISTAAAKDLSRQMGSKDILLMPSIVDVAGLNNISRVLIQQAAAAICAMANVVPVKDHSARGTIAISMFGNTSACVDTCSTLLRARGYEVLAFHANGAGGKTMESLIAEHCFDAVLDVTTTELADDLCHGICSAGPERLEAAAAAGIPQVVVPGCLDMVNFAQMDTVPESYKNRQLYSWAPDVTLMRTNREENTILGKTLAQKINRATAPVAVLIPLRGISQVDAEGGIFFDPAADQALFESIRQNVADFIPVTAVDAHINDPAFAHTLVETLLDLLETR